MDSSVNGRAQIVPKGYDDNNHFPANKKNITPYRTPSFSSSSSSSCSSSLRSLYFPDDSPLSPATPLRFSGVPFSWEHLPGIPKKNIIYKRKESISKPQQQLLPLPPTCTPPSSKKYNFQQFLAARGKKNSTENFKRDPFIAALVECSKDNDDDDDDDEDHDQDHPDRSSRNLFNGGKVTRSISDRLGFVHLHASCKKTCAVSESIVYLPRSSGPTSYDLIRRRSR